MEGKNPNLVLQAFEPQSSLTLICSYYTFLILRLILSQLVDPVDFISSATCYSFLFIYLFSIQCHGSFESG